MKLALILLAALIFISAVEIVYARHQARKLFVEIQELEKARDILDEEWGRLQLEQSTWATDSRIESLARGELKMKLPDIKSIVLITQEMVQQ